MKRLRYLLLLSFLTLGPLAWSRCPIDIWGVSKKIDTLTYRQVGPGIRYAFMRLPEYPINVHMMTIDLNNQYNTVETFQSYDRTGSTESMTHAYSRLSSTGHTPIGSVNGNFWVVSGQGQPAELLGVPYSGSVRNGEMITDPNGWNRGRGTTAEENLNDIGFAAIDENRKVWITDMGFDGKVFVEGIGEYPISEINRIRKSDELVFFNSYAGQFTRTDDSGTEVFIKPVGGLSWSVNKETLCEVVRIVKDKGANPIGEGESVLSGNGKAKVFLDNLSVGQQIKVNMGIYTLADKLRPAIKQLVTGNALVMKNGLLTPRNTNEDYNSTLYPRTGIGMSEDGKTLYLIVIDGKSSLSVGASTATMCGILKAAGADNATSMDGGGSAQMMLKGQIVNKAADGKERAVANGWMLFSTAPADNRIANFEFSDYILRIPAMASYKPAFLGYNQYGVLSDENLEGVTLSCDPTLGQIIDGQFVASSIPGKGKLVAHYNEIQIEKEVTIEESEVGFRLDSVLLDNKLHYPIEVQSKSGDQVFSINPSFLTWEVGDPTVCTMEKGTLTGLSNGSTWVTGILGNFKDTIKVNVEIPSEVILPVAKFIDLSTWTVKGSSNILNMSLTSSIFPVSIKYTYSSGRSPYVLLYKVFPLYSIPDSMKIILNSGKTGITKAILTVRANNQSTYSPIEYTGIEMEKDFVLNFPMGKILTDVNDRACYPVYFEGLKFLLNSATQTLNETYEIQIKEFSLNYGNINVGFDNPELLSRLRVYPNPVIEGVAYVCISIDTPQKARMELYSLSGKLLRSEDLGTCQTGEIRLPLQGILSGSYLLKIYLGNKNEVMKIIVH